MRDESNSDTESYRKQGIAFGALGTALEKHSYPATARELIGTCGDREVEVAEGTRTLRELLGPVDADRTFDSTEEVEKAILGMVGDEALGRTEYTDRGGNAHEREDQESF
ncbi:MAG: hypothetical protein ABEJ06_03710 [Haloarculaceae archaeon]